MEIPSTADASPPSGVIAKTRPGRRAGQRRWVLPVVLAAIAGFLTPTVVASPIERSGLSLDYEVYFSGFHLATADIEVDLLPDAYQVRLAAESSGLLGVFSAWSTTAESVGGRAGGAVAPQLHRVERPRDDDIKITRMTFAEDGTVDVLVTPGNETDGGGVPEALRRGAVDPLSAAVGVIAGAPDPAAACGRRVEIYDARRRYDAVVGQAVPETLSPNRYAAYAGPAVRCRMTLEPVAGAFGDRDGDDDGAWRRGGDRDRSRSANLWLARTVPNGPLMPVRIEADTRFGRVIVHLSNVEPREPSVAERPASVD